MSGDFLWKLGSSAAMVIRYKYYDINIIELLPESGKVYTMLLNGLGSRDS